MENICKQLPKNEKSKFNIKYLWFKYLQMGGFKCEPEDFRTTEPRDIIERYDGVWCMVWKK